MGTSRPDQADPPEDRQECLGYRAVTDSPSGNQGPGIGIQQHREAVKHGNLQVSGPALVRSATLRDMTPEERFEMHEQWLHSMDSNHAQFAEELANQRQLFSEQLSELLGAVATIATHMSGLAQGLAELRAIVETHIRFHGDGNQPAGSN